MKIYNKKIGEINLLSLIILSGVLIIFIIIGSFCDLKISQCLAKNGTFFGSLMENFGNLPGLLMSSVGCAMIFVALMRKDSKLYEKIIATILLTICLFVVPLFNKKVISGSYGFGWQIPRIIGYFIYVILAILIFIISYRLIDENIDKKVLIRNGLIILLTIFISTFIINYGLKRIVYRPRFRALMWKNTLFDIDALGVEYYKNWWNFSLFVKPDWVKSLNLPKDFLKSWPSGHTSCAAIVTTIPYFSTVLKNNTKRKSLTLYILAIAYSFLVGFARIHSGAHYLTDVSFGFLITSVIIVLVSFVLYKLIRNKI